MDERPADDEDKATSPDETPEKAQAKGTFNPVVFSRKETFSPPGEYDEDEGENAEPAEPKDSSSALQSIVTQTDRNGNAQTSAPSPEAPNSPHASRRSRVPQRGNDLDDSSDDDEDEREQTAVANNGMMSRVCCCLFGSEPNSRNSHHQNQMGSSVGPKDDLLGPLHTQDKGKKCLVLDLDETLVHSSFKPTARPADYKIPVDIEGNIHTVFVCKRPEVDEFMRVMGELYEIVIYTASLSKYANPLLDELDIHNVIRHRLFREHCVNHEGSFVKDLSLLGRDMRDCIIIDNSPLSYIWHNENAIGCDTFMDDMADKEMVQIQNFLVQLAGVKDVREHLYKWPELSMAQRQKLGNDEYDVIEMCNK